LVAEGAAVDAASLAEAVSGETRVRGRHVSAWVPAEDAVRALEKLMAAAGPEGLEDVRLITPTLEDVYLEVGGRSIEEAEVAR
ncbi:MAG TPA: hypothetical protein VFS18_02755, partial [Actinomycetota bacterium]|nr:hypothetical protein [Actinomycetota bacterium]